MANKKQNEEVTPEVAETATDTISEAAETATDTISEAAAAPAKKTVKVNDEPKTYLVKTPVPGFNGVGAAGVQFAYGQAEVKEGWVLEWYRERGYEIIEKK